MTKSEIYEWSHVDAWSSVYTIQVVADNVEAAREKAIKYLEERKWNKFLLEKVKSEEPKIYDEGIQTILEYDCEPSDIDTF